MRRVFDFDHQVILKYKGMTGVVSDLSLAHGAIPDPLRPFHDASSCLSLLTVG
jgi:hypothetical protein